MKIDWPASLAQLDNLTTYASIASECGTSRQAIYKLRHGLSTQPHHALGHKLIGILADFELDPITGDEK